MAKIIDGKAIAASVLDSVRPTVAALAERGVRPGLAVILAGDESAARLYVRNKVRACENAGVRFELHEYPGDVAERTLLELIAELNRDPRVHGILVQLPLPPHISAQRVLAAPAPAKDVDGFHLENLGALLTGHPRVVPCTPAGVMHLLAHEGVALAGRHAVVVGRSNIVGKPLALLLLQNDATVTICHSRTARLAEITRQGDVLVAAAGCANLIRAEMVKPGACVIDVGINRLADGTLAGDVDFARVKGVAGHITPVPGGVGPMTVAMLIVNTVRAATRALGST
ncbi:MAG TPA: bifunctional methylenetetrahydrofolate dehydrogenase/methenyltetrahydrofolate cyclohydrolase FolD [Burkholderiales bacterium]|nr:bifunctional methylenetetrahydrofolate dehydrogenase/methenyltetrahydrofolate cyclohydrolase FolD [Burkholderiales bacterium]